MFKTIVELLRKLVALAEERNTLELGQLSELRDIHQAIQQIEEDEDENNKLLTEIAAELVSKPSTAASLVITLGKAVQQ